jgi:hypothetical protein
MLPAQAADYQGDLGRAWRVDFRTLLRKKKAPADQDATVAYWYVNAPYAHPVWHSYVIGAIHLRDIPGQSKPATINLPGATHEVFLFALDPDRPIDVAGPPHYLANYIGQFIEPSDEAAVERIERAVRDICDGVLNPDTDYTQWWIRRFSASNIKGDPARAGETRIQVGEMEVVIPPQAAPND